MHVGVAWFLAVSAALFGIGLYGVFTRRSPIILLLSVEIMLNASNLALVSFGRYWGDPAGQVFALVVMAVAASEVVIGLGASARRSGSPTSSTTSRSSITTAPASTSSRSTRGRRPAASASRSTS